MATGTLEQTRIDGWIADEPLYEIVDGERVELAPMGKHASSIANVLAFFLNQFAYPRKLGFAFVEMLFEMIPGRPKRRPAVAFVATESEEDPPVPSGDDNEAWRVVPRCATEVVSPTNTAEGIECKIVEYFAAGVELVWVIYPRQRRIYVYESPTQARVLGINDELDGGKVLSGFRLKLADLFGAARLNKR